MQNPRKKVLFLITKSTLGGAQRYVQDLATELDNTAYDVAVAVGGDGPLIDILTASGIKVYPLKNLTRDIGLIREIRSFFELLLLVRKVKPDVLHINSSKAGGLGSVVGRLCRVRNIVFTAHGWAFNEDRPNWQKTLFKAFHFLTILFSHHTITVSNGTRAQMDWPFIQKKMTTVHLGREVSEMKSKEDARGTLEMHVQNSNARLIDYHNDFWLGTIAELHPIKRLDRAITSVSVLVKEFPALRFVIIHDGQLRTKLEAQVRDLGLENHVFFTGTIENAARLLPAFDAFVLPSKSEAFAYVLLEAGQAKLPVVATRVGGIPDIIEDGVNGLLVPQEDTPALTAALRSLIIDEPLREKLATAHFEKSHTFTLEKMAKETEEVYKQ
jgi:glycosyltransferase involved in cell wall biosynthesis